MKKTSIAIFAVLSSLVVVGQSCSDDGDDGDNMAAAGSSGSGGNTMTGNLQPFEGALGPNGRPTLGPQIDRIGRPAISAALIGTFEADGGQGIRDQYNEGSLSDNTFQTTMRQSLAILDGLDGNCGNQAAYNANVEGTERYAGLATVLLDDQLYLHSGRTGCGPAYLGLEAEIALQAIAEGEGQCGGRQPNEDVIATSYSVLAAGALDGSIDDGVPADDQQHLPDTFPFLRPPQQ